MKLRFSGVDETGFFADVRRSVDNYFKENQITKRANGAMIAKVIFLLSSMVGLYGLVIFQVGNSMAVTLIFAVLLGIVQAEIGFNVAHDAIHGSFSNNRKVNKYLGYVFNIIGANDYVWDIYHNQIHHTYTNIAGHDEDIDVAPGMIRLSPEEEWKPMMKYQHIYAFFLYSLASLSWVFRKDYKKMFQSKGHQAKQITHPKKQYFKLFLFKAVYYTIFIVVPLLVMEIAWWQFIIGFVAMHLAEGLVLGLVFQLAHVVEDTEFPNPNESGNMEDSWAIHQMITTANFSPNSKFATFMCGGLNYQVEHHLFPNICHIHYPKIAGIVRSVAEKHNVPYNVNITFAQALKSHYQTLKRFGQVGEIDQVNRVDQANQAKQAKQSVAA